MQPGAGQVKRLLRPDVPNAAEGMSVDPDESFGEFTGIEEGVAGLLNIEGAAIEARASTGAVAKRELAGVLHGQSKNLP